MLGDCSDLIQISQLMMVSCERTGLTDEGFKHFIHEIELNFLLCINSVPSTVFITKTNRPPVSYNLKFLK